MAENQQSGQEPNGESQDIDYKAKYEEAIAHSREWEKRAKANKTAADELERARIGYTLNVFTSAEGLNGVNAAAKDVLAGGNAEVLKNFLKVI